MKKLSFSRSRNSTGVLGYSIESWQLWFLASESLILEVVGVPERGGSLWVQVLSMDEETMIVCCSVEGG